MSVIACHPSRLVEARQWAVGFDDDELEVVVSAVCPPGRLYWLPGPAELLLEQLARVDAEAELMSGTGPGPVDTKTGETEAA